MDLGGRGEHGARTGVPVLLALDALSTSLDHVVKIVEDGGLDDLDSSELVEFFQSFEQVRNRLPLVDHSLIHAADRRDLPQLLCQGSMRRVLASALRISKAEAARRVRAAEAVGRRVSPLGEQLAPVRPQLAAAQRSGSITPEQVGIVERALGQVDRRGFDPADIDAGERLLTRHASTFAPEDLRGLAQRVVDAIDPDGTLPDEQLNQDRRHFHLRPTRDGAYVGEFRLTGAVGAKLKALLDPLAKVRTPLGVATSDGAPAPGTAWTEPDGRTHGQRMHDAVEEVCDRLLRSGDAPDTGGVPATVIVTLSWDELLGRLGYGRTGDGTLISAARVLELADNADIIPTVLNASGAVVALGRSRRIASRSQTLALYARDSGCSFPGCAHPPQYCERHHVVAWIDGGNTDLDNLTLLCRYHHHNFAARGWTCRINGDGLPELTPPPWMGRDQQPMINTRIQAALTARRNLSHGRRGGLRGGDPPPLGVAPPAA